MWRNTHLLSWHKIWKGSYFVSETNLFLLVRHLIINGSPATFPVFVWHPLLTGYWSYSCNPCCRTDRRPNWSRDATHTMRQGKVQLLCNTNLENNAEKISNHSFSICIPYTLFLLNKATECFISVYNLFLKINPNCSSVTLSLGQ